MRDWMVQLHRMVMDAFRGDSRVRISDHLEEVRQRKPEPGTKFGKVVIRYIIDGVSETLICEPRHEMFESDISDVAKQYERWIKDRIAKIGSDPTRPRAGE